MNDNILQKRLLYKSCNRGWKETDIILGEFSKDNIDKLTTKQLEMLDLLLDESDSDIFNWVTGKAPVVTKHDNEVMKMLQAKYLS